MTISIVYVAIKAMISIMAVVVMPYHNMLIRYAALMPGARLYWPFFRQARVYGLQVSHHGEQACPLELSSQAKSRAEAMLTVQSV